MMRRLRYGIVMFGCAAACLLSGPVGCASSGIAQPNASDAYARDLAERLQRAQSLAEKAERTEDPMKKATLLREAVETYSQHSTYWINLGTALAELEDYASAAEAFAQASDLDPTDPRPPYNHGTVYFRRGYPQDAMGYYEESLRRDRNYLNAIRGYVRTSEALYEFDADLADLLDRAVILETDPEWLDYFKRRRIKVRVELGLEGEVN